MKKLLCFLLALLLTAGTAAVPAQAADTVRALSTRSNGCPYYIMVNRRQSTVTVYGLDDSGYYTVPVRAMVCSTGRKGHATPLGNFSIYGERDKWHYMVDGTYGQYACRFNGSILFHSICYRRADPSAMLTDEYNALGGPASLGCVRLQVIDAKWIYDNCVNGTLVTVYESDDPGPLGKPDKAVEKITSDMPGGWDPTDPRDSNPWNQRRLTAFSVQERYLTLEAGESRQLTVQRAPANAGFPKAEWSSDNPQVAAVDSNGVVTARGDGTAVITVTCSGFTDRCSVEVHGNLLPFHDVAPGAWYYADVRYAYENKLIAGITPNTFAPLSPMSRAEILQVLYGMAGKPKADDLPVTAGVRSWYADALHWAKKEGLLEGFNTSGLSIYDSFSKAELAVLLYRYEFTWLEGKAGTFISPDSLKDADAIDPSLVDAVRWAVGSRLLTNDGAPLAEGGTTRAEAAAVLHRFCGLEEP